MKLGLFLEMNALKKVFGLNIFSYNNWFKNLNDIEL